MAKIRLGLEEWRKLEKELERIGGGQDLELLINLSLGHPHHGDHEHHDELERTPFVEEALELIKRIEDMYGVRVHQHLHGDHGSILVPVRGTPHTLVSALRDIVKTARDTCSECSLHGVDGEVHLGEKLSGIYFGDAYKLTFILPGSDGRTLEVIELHL